MGGRRSGKNLPKCYQVMITTRVRSWGVAIPLLEKGFGITGAFKILTVSVKKQIHVNSSLKPDCKGNETS